MGNGDAGSNSRHIKLILQQIAAKEGNPSIYVWKENPNCILALQETDFFTEYVNPSSISSNIWLLKATQMHKFQYMNVVILET